MNVCTGTSDSRQCLVAAVLEHGVDPQGYIRAENIIVSLYKLSCYPHNILTPLEVFFTVMIRGGTAVAQWLRCCDTNRKVAGSIPDDVIGIFH